MNKQELEHFAQEIRCISCEMMLARGDGHIGGSLSIADVLAVVFGKYRRRTEDVSDWFVLSKGHAGPAYYATLMLTGELPMDHIDTLNANGTLLPSHPDRCKTPGVEVTTGSLGQGVAQAVGIAYGLKAQGKPGFVYCIVGDGEFEEGETFEAIQFAAGKHLDNFILLIDRNEKQVDGLVSEVACPFNFAAILAGCGMGVCEIDGHDVSSIDEAIKRSQGQKGISHAIVLDTIKGKGVPYFEAQPNPHHVTFSDADKRALRDYIESCKREVYS